MRLLCPSTFNLPFYQPAANLGLTCYEREPPTRRYPELGRGAAAGVLAAAVAGVEYSHVLTRMPPVDATPGANRLGTENAVDFFTIDLEPSRGSSLMAPVRPARYCSPRHLTFPKPSPDRCCSPRHRLVLFPLLS